MPDLPPVPSELPSEPPPSYSGFSMPQENKNMLIFLALLIIGGLLGFLYNKQQSLGQQTVTVVGNAKLTVNTNKAIIAGSTEAIDNTSEKTQASAKNEIDKIRTALINLGLSQNHFVIKQTYAPSDYYDDDDFPQFGKATYEGQNYAALSLFEVVLEGKEVNDIDKYLKVLKLYNASPTVTYAIIDRHPYDVEIKQKAIEDAKKQAESLANNNRLKVTRLVSVVEHTSQEKTQTTEAKSTSPEKQVTFDASYEVTYELGPKLFPF